MMPPPETNLEELHMIYNRLTNQSLRFRPFERLWWDFRQHGYDAHDLEMTVKYIEARNRKETFKISLRLNLLLDDLARFESYRGEADLEARRKAAAARAWKPTAGEQARASMCGHDPVPPQKEPPMPREMVARLFSDMSRNLSQT